MMQSSLERTLHGCGQPLVFELYIDPYSIQIKELDAINESE